MIGNHDFSDTLNFVKANLTDLGRRKCFSDEIMLVFRERNNVNFLTAQFIYDLTHTRSSRSNAGSYWVNVGVVRPDSDLGAMAWFSGTSFHFDNPIADFRNFKLEKFANQSRMSARHDNLRTFGCFTNFNDVRL